MSYRVVILALAGLLSVAVNCRAQHAVDELQATLPQPDEYEPVQVTFVHVDTTGVLGRAFARRIQLGLDELSNISTVTGADFVMWLRTIDFHADGKHTIAYSVIVDFKGAHVTDNLGLSGISGIDDAAQSIVAAVGRLSLQLQTTGTIASNQ